MQSLDLRISQGQKNSTNGWQTMSHQALMLTPYPRSSIFFREQMVTGTVLVRLPPESRCWSRQAAAEVPNSLSPSTLPHNTPPCPALRRALLAATYHFVEVKLKYVHRVGTKWHILTPIRSSSDDCSHNPALYTARPVPFCVYYWEGLGL